VMKNSFFITLRWPLSRLLRCTGMCECPERQDAERDRSRHLGFLPIAV